MTRPTDTVPPGRPEESAVGEEEIRREELEAPSCHGGGHGAPGLRSGPSRTLLVLLGIAAAAGAIYLLVPGGGSIALLVLLGGLMLLHHLPGGHHSSSRGAKDAHEGHSR